MITSLAHKIHKLPSITVARVNFSIHRNKSFSLPTMSELRFLLYNTWMTRWNLSVGTVLTFPARLLFFFFFLPGQNYENHPRELHINSLKKSHYDHHQLKVVAGARPLLRLPTIWFPPVSPRKQIPNFFFISRLTHCCGLGRRLACTHLCWFQLGSSSWLLQGFHFIRLIRNRLVTK